jgi:hypothetical protein
MPEFTDKQDLIAMHMHDSRPYSYEAPALSETRDVPLLLMVMVAWFKRMPY